MPLHNLRGGRLDQRDNSRSAALRAASGLYAPFGSGCSFRKPIPASPSVHASSAAMVTKLTGWGLAGNLLPGESSTATWVEYGSPIYYAAFTDPLFTVQKSTPGFSGGNWGTQIRIPQGAIPADGTDVHMCVVHPDGVTCWEFYNLTSDLAGANDITAANPLPSGGGTIYAGGLGKYDLSSRGDGMPSPYTGGGDKQTAGGPSMLIGDIWPEHLLAGRIPFALRMAVKSTGTTYDGDGIVAPAIGAAGQTDPTNAPPCGARMQLNMTSAAIQALGVGSFSKVLLECLREFGAYVTDTTGANYKFYLASGLASYQLRGVDPWRTLATTHASAQGWSYVGAPDDVWVWNDWRSTLNSNMRWLDWTDAANR